MFFSFKDQQKIPLRFFILFGSIVLTGLLLYSLLFFSWTFFDAKTFLVDDAYIAFRYVENWLAGV